MDFELKVQTVYEEAIKPALDELLNIHIGEVHFVWEADYRQIYQDVFRLSAHSQLTDQERSSIEKSAGSFEFENHGINAMSAGDLIAGSFFGSPVQEKDIRDAHLRLAEKLEEWLPNNVIVEPAEAILSERKLEDRINDFNEDEFKIVEKRNTEKNEYARHHRFEIDEIINGNKKWAIVSDIRYELFSRNNFKPISGLTLSGKRKIKGRVLIKVSETNGGRTLGYVAAIAEDFDLIKIMGEYKGLTYSIKTDI